jgi:hypothetical protein
MIRGVGLFRYCFKVYLDNSLFKFRLNCGYYTCDLICFSATVNFLLITLTMILCH